MPATLGAARQILLCGIAGGAKPGIEFCGFCAWSLPTLAPFAISVRDGAFDLGRGGICSQRGKARNQRFARQLIGLEFPVARGMHRIALRKNSVGCGFELRPQCIFNLTHQWQRFGVCLPFGLQFAYLGDDLAVFAVRC